MHPLRPPRELLLPFPSSAGGGPTGAHRGGETFLRLTAGRWPGLPEYPVGEGKCSPREEKVQHLLGGAKSPVGAQECGEVGRVTTQECRHQVVHQRERDKEFFRQTGRGRAFLAEGSESRKSYD